MIQRGIHIDVCSREAENDDSCPELAVIQETGDLSTRYAYIASLFITTLHSALGPACCSTGYMQGMKAGTENSRQLFLSLDMA